jgi:hypothetical protein
MYACGNALCSRKPTLHKARHTMSGSGRYEPIVRSAVRPQKSRLKACSQPMCAPGSDAARTYGFASSASCSSKMKLVDGGRVKRTIETRHDGTSALRSVGSSEK